MQSLRELYKIGRGPSSSHTMGPEKAILIVKEKYKEADSFEVVLYGSLALTGKGHGTDRIIEETIAPIPCQIKFDKKTPCDIHPNTMEIIAYQGGKKKEPRDLHDPRGRRDYRTRSSPDLP